MRVNLNNRVALVTGAGSGLGKSMCEVLSEAGATIVAADIDDVAGGAIVDQLTSIGREAHFLHLDVGEEEQWRAAMDAIREKFKRLHILVNNAGIAPEGDMEMSFSLWKKVLQVNLDGTFLGMQAGIRLMREHSDPCSIVNISSMMAMAAEPTTAAYSASKGGVRSLTKSAALYCGHHGLSIRINSVHPGMCITPLVEGYFDKYPEKLDMQKSRYPIGHLGKPEDIANGVLYLASDLSAFTTGSELVIDGGYLAQ